MRTRPFALLAAGFLLLAAGCEPDEGGDCVIEETGYLQPCAIDPELIGWTVFETRAQSVGLPGAAPALQTLELHNLASDEITEATSSETGSFVAAVEGEVGDSLVLSVVDMPSAGDASWEVASLSPFPAYETLVAAPSTEFDSPVVVVEIVFAPPLTGGTIRVANQANDHVNYLDVFQDGAVHGGHIAGLAGDILLLFWAGSGDALHSAALEVEVTDSGD